MVAVETCTHPVFTPESPPIYHEMNPLQAYLALLNDMSASNRELAEFKKDILEKEREEGIPTIGDGRYVSISPGRTLEPSYYRPLAEALVADGFRPRILSGGEGLRRYSLVDEGEDMIRSAEKIKDETGQKSIIVTHSKSGYAILRKMRDESTRVARNISHVVIMGAHPQARIEPTLASNSWPWLALSPDYNLLDDIKEIEEVPKIIGVKVTIIVSSNDPIVQLPLNFRPQEENHMIESSHYGMPHNVVTYRIILQDLVA